MKIRKITCRQTKKADPTDVILLLVMLFFLVIGLVVAIYANTKIQNIISTTVLNQSAAYSSINQSFESVNGLGVQRAFTFIFGLLLIGIIVSSFLIRVHPVFIFLYIIMLAIAIFVSIFLANAYALLIDNPEFSTISEKYQMMTWVMQHIVLILIVVGALSMIIIFGKIGGGTNNSMNFSGGDI